MTHDPFVLRPGAITLSDLRRLDDPAVRLELSGEARENIRRGHAALGRIMARGQLVYGVNTGFGPLSDQQIAPEAMSELQRRLVLSNAVGTGPALPDRIVRRIIVLKLATLSAGASGVREELADALLALLDRGLVPVIPAKGSVGASGDLAPLAHLGAALIGEGEIKVGGRSMPAAEALRHAGLGPLSLAPKEGLALVNGTQVSTALAVEGLFRADALFTAALAIGALSLEAGGGNASAFDPRIHALRGQAGQRLVAERLRALVTGSGIQSAGGAKRVQDPYCLRCQPQVMGGVLDQLAQAARVLSGEIVGVSDNPLIDAEQDEVLYGGNFHAQPIALTAEGIAYCLAEIGSMSERRTAFLVDSRMSGLPAFLVAEGGLNSGFMVAQVTAAALASENKALAHPGSLDSIPTAANQEDYVSMATFAARRLGEMADNLRDILAIELLAAAQGLELRRPVRTSDPLEALVARLRGRVAPWRDDRFFAPDLAKATALLEQAEASGPFSPPGTDPLPILEQPAERRPER